MSEQSKTALVVVAHADDLEYNIGGTIARFVEAGYDVYRVAVTDSSRGTFEPGMTVERMAEIGVAEAQAAGGVLGLKGNLFLNPLPEATCAVDIGPYLETKVKALLKYESQMRLAYDAYVAYQKAAGVPADQWPRPVSADNYRQLMGEAIRREAREVGKAHGMPHAEVFRYGRNLPRYP